MFILTSTAYSRSFSYKTTERNLPSKHQRAHSSAQMYHTKLPPRLCHWNSSSNSNLLHWWGQERDLRTQHWPCEIQQTSQLALAKVLWHTILPQGDAERTLVHTSDICKAAETFHLACRAPLNHPCPWDSSYWHNCFQYSLKNFAPSVQISLKTGLCDRSNTSNTDKSWG